jgi:hypothetical protein
MRRLDISDELVLNGAVATLVLVWLYSVVRYEGDTVLVQSRKLR